MKFNLNLVWVDINSYGLDRISGIRAPPRGSPLGSLLGMSRAKLQKWCSSNLCRDSPHFLNAIVSPQRKNYCSSPAGLKNNITSLFIIYFFSSQFSLLSLLSPLCFLVTKEEQLYLSAPSPKPTGGILR